MKIKCPIYKEQVIDIEIKGITYQGWGVGNFEGFTVFVPNTLPGEKVKAQIIQMKKSFAVANVIEILESAETREKPRCVLYENCGGCQIQHANYLQQLEIKRQLVVDSITRIGKLDGIKVHPVIGMNEPWGYRNKVQFHVESRNGEVKIGFYRPGTRNLISLDQCHLLPPVFNKIATFLKEILTELSVPIYIPNKAAGLKHVVLRISRISGEIALMLVTSSSEVPGLKKCISLLMNHIPQVVSVVQNVNPRSTSEIFGDKWILLAGKERIEDKIGEITFSISPESFVQVNPVQTEKLYAKALEYADLNGTEHVTDVYCGIGTITLFLAQKAKKVFGIEEVPGAIKDAEKNAKLNHITNTKFFAGKAEEVLPQMAEQGIKADIIVVDPPRKGCDPAVLDAMVQMGPERIVYISCDPGTLARDLKILDEKGYRTLEIQPVDMFPHTGHVECVVLMSRKDK